MADIKFGTDGWRAIIGEDYTFDNVRRLSQAVADYFGPGKKAAVGYDSRFMSASFAQAVSEVLSANGIEVILSDRLIPTPTLSWTVKNRRLDFGVMITASHNPAEYNGFKLKSSNGGAAGLELTRGIEKRLGASEVKYALNPVRNCRATGKEKEVSNGVNSNIRKDDLTSSYIRFIRSYLDFKKLKVQKFKVLVDAMYGSGDSYIAEILKGTGIRLEFIRNSVNPSFAGGRPEPLEDNLTELKQRMKQEGFDIGIALDGDADRLSVVGKDGVFIHPQKILGLLALHLHQGRGWSGGIVKTIAGTAMIDNIAKFLRVKLYETPVGFKYISSLMEKEDILAGGEEAGGMGVKGYIPERDGTVAGLLLLEMMAYRHKPISKILEAAEKQFGRYYYLRNDLQRPFLPRRIALWEKGRGLPKELLGKKVIQVKDYDGIKLICGDESWLMFRPSGTELLMRLYSEAKTLKRARQLLALGEKLIRN